MIYIILMEPENEGNVGAIARVMKNFGFKNLVLINPKVEITEVTKARAKHAQDILNNVKIKDAEFLKTMDTLIGTTAKVGTDYNIPRSPVSPKEMAKKITKKKKTGILIGREGIGLTNEEIQNCDFTVTIPASKKYFTLNISHALGILLYELFQETETINSTSDIEPASKNEKTIISKQVHNILEKLTFTTEDKVETQKRVWKRFIGKAMLTKREAFALIGFFKKVEKNQKNS